ncbi:hypothetical protein CKAN_00696700 [Cinnamomum micranthum f. kanehirae]|uniref:Uncharacterized protein n=1 Tax=Cinnamomum micranthum f. kanehirae TaxID=337451 RepID=A0A3S3Q474_9MAGN|nr:hypothetical protein CKAN_00696700 [Cinnamomum micranthum f. kanehirae]
MLCSPPKLEVLNPPLLIQASLSVIILVPILFPSSPPSIKSLTTLAISSLFTTPLSPAVSLTATFRFSTRINAFVLCSACSGNAIMGTPCTMLSCVEFHPQCQRNPPVDPWLRTSICGTHKGTTWPSPLVLSKNPSGRKSNGSCWLPFTPKYDAHASLQVEIDGQRQEVPRVENVWWDPNFIGDIESSRSEEIDDKRGEVVGRFEPEGL